MTNEKSNLELSEETVRAILQVLADRGFSKGQFSFNDLKRVGIDDECSQFFDLSIRWLIEEGIIRVAKLQEYVGGEPLDAMSPMITAKGLSLIGKRLETRDGQVVLADFEDSQSESSGGYRHVGTFLGSLFGSYTKSMG